MKAVKPAAGTPRAVFILSRERFRFSLAGARGVGTMAPLKEGKPRSHVGGRSPRHAERHAARGYARTFAPSWTDAVAHTVLQALQEGSHAAGEGITQHVMAVLSTGAAVRRFAGRLHLSADDRAVAVAILMVHSAKVAALHARG